MFRKTEEKRGDCGSGVERDGKTRYVAVRAKGLKMDEVCFSHRSVRTDCVSRTIPHLDMAFDDIFASGINLPWSFGCGVMEIGKIEESLSGKRIIGPCMSNNIQSVGY
jgi:hypothetical protein